MNSSFIKNLSEEINKKVVYSEGRKDSRETSSARMQIFLLATPSSPEEIRDYVLYAKMAGAFKEGEVRKRVSFLLGINDLSDSYIKQANEVFHAEKKKVLIKSLALLLPPMLIVAGLLWAWYDSYIQYWDTIWQVLCYTCVWFPVGSGALLPYRIWTEADIF